jgi:hypothetical protein
MSARILIGLLALFASIASASAATTTGNDLRRVFKRTAIRDNISKILTSLLAYFRMRGAQH